MFVQAKIRLEQFIGIILSMEEADRLQCADKLVFDSEKEAEAEARAIKYRRGVSLKAYKCRYCGLWHLSSGRSG